MHEKVKLKLVALGDSLTVGFQPSPLFLSRVKGLPYTQTLHTLLENELRERGLDNEVIMKNAGILGDTTSSMLDRFNLDVVKEKPDYVIVLGGINDLYMLLSPENIFSNLMQIYIRALEADIGPIACTLTSVLGFDRLIPNIKNLNYHIREYCKEKSVPLADLFSATSDSSGILRKKYSSDGIHLSSTGYQKVAYTIYFQVLDKILDDL